MYHFAVDILGKKISTIFTIFIKKNFHYIAISIRNPQNFVKGPRTQAHQAYAIIRPCVRLSIIRHLNYIKQQKWVVVVGLSPIVCLWDQGLQLEYPPRRSFKGSYSEITRVSKKNTKNSVRIGRHVLPGIEPGTSLLLVLSSESLRQRVMATKMGELSLRYRIKCLLSCSQTTLNATPKQFFIHIALIQSYIQLINQLTNRFSCSVFFTAC